MFAMTPRLSMQIEAVLRQAVQRAEARSVFLCDKGGNVVAQYATGHEDECADTISALAAGSFFATQELARIIGEGEFHCVFHQGGQSSLYMQSLVREMLMLVVFGKESNPGLVRLYANQAAKTVANLMDQSSRQAVSEPAGGGVRFEIDAHAQPFTRSRLA